LALLNGSGSAKLMKNLVHLTGIGRLYEGARQLCTAHYDIQVQRIAAGTSDLDERTSGTIDPIGATIEELLGRRLTMLFEDARKLDFYLTDKGFVVSIAAIY
jgi:hypothetical protein